MACNEMHGLEDPDNPTYVMKVYPGKDITPDGNVPLDSLLTDEGVVEVIQKNYSEFLVEDKLFEDEETLRMFFGEERDSGLIKQLFALM